MASRVVNTGLTYLLDYQLAHSGGDAWKIGLYTNMPSVAPTTVLADIVQATFPGYAAQSVGPFNASVIDTFNEATATPVTPTVTFQRSSTGSPQTTTGLYLFAGTRLIYLESFAGGGFTFQLLGDRLDVGLFASLPSLFG